MRLQQKLGKGTPIVRADGSMYFEIPKAGTPPSALEEIEKLFKKHHRASSGFQLNIDNSDKLVRRYTIRPMGAP